MCYCTKEYGYLDKECRKCKNFKKETELRFDKIPDIDDFINAYNDALAIGFNNACNRLIVNNNFK